MTQQCCDIENQCQHFCVYKQMVCPVYIRVSHSNATDRDKLLDEMCMRCPCLDWRPDNCENCLVETIRKEFRIPAPEQP